MKPVEKRCQELLGLYLNNYSIDTNSYNIEFLVDTLTCLYYECNSLQHRNERNCQKFCSLVKSLVETIESYRLSRSEFETIRLIGSGAFGEVSLVRSRLTNEYFALKSLHKYDMLKRSDRACFLEERDVLVKGMIKESPWLTQLYHTFQDEKYLYFVMKFYNGGDMLTMLSKFDDQIPEDISRFYICELVQAINSLHDLGYVHRDIKPDNVLLETSGHIVLTDFGSCLRIGSDGLIKNTAAVGTPDYIAPEILRAAEDSHGAFGVECDYWSLGVVMYEMLFGETPFYSENLIQTYSQIMNFEKTFKFPENEDGVSEDAKDLLKNFICDRKQRYGRNGIKEIAEHPFFTGIDWNNIRSQPAPYQPEVKSPEDTSNFDIEEAARTHEGPPLGSVFRGCQVACIGFTFTKDSALNQIGRLGQSLNIEKSMEEVATITTPATATTAADVSCLTCSELKSRVQCLECELQELTLKVHAPPSPIVNGASVTAEAAEELAASGAQSNQLVAEVQRLQMILDATEIRCISEEQQNAHLSKALEEEQERTERLKFDIREYEEENEDLCKRIQETSFKLRDKEAACERLLNDLDEKRAELAAQRRLMDEYIRQQQLTKAAAVVTVGEANHSNGFSDTASGTMARITAGTTELKLKLHEAVTWAEECESKLANQDIYWTDQKLRWQRERSELQDRIREIVLERTSSLEGELRQERQRCSALEQRVMLWENQLVELIRMADNEWAANDNLHNTVLHMMSDLQHIINWSPDGAEYEERRPASGTTTSLTLNGGGGSCNAADWRQRKAGRISKMERSNLQLSLKNEIRERELAQQRMRELEVQLEEMTSRLSDTSSKLLQTEQEKENLRDQLVNVTNAVRRSRIKTAEEDEPACLPTEQINGVHPLAHRTTETTAVRQTSKSSEKSASLHSGSGSGAASMNSHKLVPETFARPTKCLVCASLLLGHQWQGLVCQQCGLTCHLQCRHTATSLRCLSSISTPTSAVPSLDVDVTCGLGTVLEGPVKTPKGDIRRGWIQQYAFLCDMRLFIYNCTAVRRARAVNQSGTETPRDLRPSTLAADSGGGASQRSSGALSISMPQITYETAYDIHGNAPACVIDLNASGFAVYRVSNTDVIHAKRSEVPNILKVNPDNYAGSVPVYLLFETSEECERWYSALEDGVRLSGRNFVRTPDSQCLQLCLLSDASFPLIKHILSACVLDQHRILVGAEDGLYTVDLRYKTYARVGEKKPIYQVEALPEELQLVAIIQGKHRRLRLVLSGAIEGMNYEMISVAEPKSGVSLLAHGWSRSRTAFLLCAAGRSSHSVWVYEVVREASRHRHLLDLAPPSSSSSHLHALCLVRDGDCLAVGLESSFVIYNIWSGGAINVLLEPSCMDLDPSLLMFRQNRFAAQLAISVNFDEFLLVFENCGIYVDSQGQLTRQVYLFWPAKPLPRGFAYRQPFLYVFTEAGLFLFNVETSIWSASAAGLRRLRPLNTLDGHLCLMGLASSQGLSKLAINVGSGSASSANGSGISSNGSGSIGGYGNVAANASLVYLPPPRQSMFASVQRRRTNNSHLISSPLTRDLGVNGNVAVERQLELDNVVLLDANTRSRKSRRFSIFSRGPLFGSLTDTAATDHAAVCGGSAGGLSASGSTTGSRLISAPSDFQLLAHQGPDVRIHYIDLAQSRQTARYSSNFSLAAESALDVKHSAAHCDSQASLHSSSSRLSTDQSLGESEVPSDPMVLDLPLPTSAAAAPESGVGEEAVTPSAFCNAFNDPNNLCPPPPTSSSQQQSPHQPTPPLDSPGFRDKVLAIFHTLDTDLLPNLNSPTTPTEELPTSS